MTVQLDTINTTNGKRYMLWNPCTECHYPLTGTREWKTERGALACAKKRGWEIQR